VVCSALFPFNNNFVKEQISHSTRFHFLILGAVMFGQWHSGAGRDLVEEAVSVRLQTNSGLVRFDNENMKQPRSGPGRETHFSFVGFD